MLAVGQPVVQAPRMRNVDEIAVQYFGSRAQGVPRIQVLLEIRVLQPLTITDGRNQSVSGLGVQFRVLVPQPFKAGADLERQGFGQHNRGGRLEILPGSIGGGGESGVGLDGSQRVAVPLVVIAFKLETKIHPVGAQMLVFVAGRNAGVALLQGVAVAGQAE